MKISWSGRALRDLRAVRDYIARDNPDAAATTAVKILDSVERPVEFPASVRPARLPNTRELIVAGTPFIIPYRITDEGVEILAVLHSSRNLSGG